MKSRAALTASAIKQELKKLYPRVKFSVRSQHHNCVRISWTDFVTAGTIEKAVWKYEMGHFDGMTDSYEYSNRREDIPQVQYVFAEQSISPAYARVLLARVKEICLQGFPMDIQVKDKECWDGSMGWELTEDYRDECGTNVYTVMRNLASYYVYLDGTPTKIDPEERDSIHNRANKHYEG